jgi:hypothetical protein
MTLKCNTEARREELDELMKNKVIEISNKFYCIENYQL